MNMKKCIGLLLAVFLCATLSTAWAVEGPRAQLRSTVDQVLAVLKKKELPNVQRRDKVTSLIQARFNFRAMAQGVLGINWRRADQKQRDRFIELFTEVLKDTYLGRIEAYSNEKVKYGDQRIEGNVAVVDTIIVTTDNKDIPVNYNLVHQGDQWLIYDVKITGVSLVLNYRTSYGAIVNRDGVDGLLKKMAAKVKELKEDADGGGKGK